MFKNETNNISSEKSGFSLFIELRKRFKLPLILERKKKSVDVTCLNSRKKENMLASPLQSLYLFGCGQRETRLK